MSSMNNELACSVYKECVIVIFRRKSNVRKCVHIIKLLLTDFTCVYHLLADYSDSDKSIEKCSLEEFLIRMGQFFRRFGLCITLTTDIQIWLQNIAYPEVSDHGN